MGAENWLVRCSLAHKPGVGTMHFHVRWWSWWRVSSLWFQPVDRTVMYRVPESAWDALLGAESFEQAVALVRGAEESPAP